MKKIKRVGIVGAGVVGCTAAFELRKLGVEVVLFEREEWVGGRMGSRVLGLEGGFSPVFDLGANHLCDLYREMKGYVKELGLEWVKMEFDHYGILYKGKFVSLKSIVSVWDGIRLGLLTARKRRILDFFDFNAAAMFDRMDAVSYLRPRIGKKMVNYVVDGFTAAYQFHRGNEGSLGFALAILESFKNEPELWQLYHLKGGMGTLCEALVREVGNERLRLGEEVFEVKKVDDGVEVVTQNGVEKFDKVVVATTAGVARKILANPSLAQINLLKEVKFAATISLAFRVRKKLLPKFSVTWCPFIESKMVCSFSNEMMKGSDTTNEEDSLLCAWLHEEFARSVLWESEEVIFEKIAEEIARLFGEGFGFMGIGVRDFVGVGMRKHLEAMPKFSVGKLKSVRDFWENGQGEGGVYLGGDYLNFPWTEGGIRCGKKIAELIAEIRG